MPFVGLGLHVLVALFFAIHAVRSGQNMYWLFILFVFPLLGSIVYFVVVLPLTIKTVADVPAAYLDVAVTKGASQWQLVRHVLFPVAKADIWDLLRGAYGVGWTWIILAEVWANAENGLGYLLEISYRRGRMDRYFAVVLVIVAIAVGFDQLWRAGSRLLFPYRYVD